jgi:hypothetical protein
MASGEDQQVCGTRSTARSLRPNTHAGSPGRTGTSTVTETRNLAMPAGKHGAVVLGGSALSWRSSARQRDVSRFGSPDLRFGLTAVW